MPYRCAPTLATAATLLILAGCEVPGSRDDDPPVLFDDFSYDSLDAFAANDWIVRTARGWPGVTGAEWSGNVSLIDDAAQAGNRLVRLTASLEGAAARQAQFCHERK